MIRIIIIKAVRAPGCCRRSCPVRRCIGMRENVWFDSAPVQNAPSQRIVFSMGAGRLVRVLRIVKGRMKRSMNVVGRRVARVFETAEE